MSVSGDRNETLDWDRLRAEIEALLAETNAAIRSYPPPIPACDAQFNHLLELRQGLPGELLRLASAAGKESANPLKFLYESPFREDLAGRGLR